MRTITTPTNPRPSPRRSFRAGVGVLAFAVAGVIAGQAAFASSGAAVHQAGGPTSRLSVSSALFGHTVEPYTGKDTDVYRYTLTNSRGMTVKVLTYGGIVQQIDVLDASGHEADVVLGFATLDDYVKYDSPPVTSNGGPYFGETIGRYGNRIAKGTFTLDQPGGPVTYHVPINNNGNSLHGGLVGFGNHIWSAAPVHGAGSVGVQLTLVSPNGDEGYPGTLKTVVTYTLNNANQLGIHYAATDESSNLNTVVNLTNHSYFNLAGENSGATYDQKVYINADGYTPTDSTQIPTGQIASVKGTPFDFTNPAGTPIGAHIGEVSANDNAGANHQLLIAQGFDHNWVLNDSGPEVNGLRLAATAADPYSGRELSVYTDQPGVQFYSGNFLTGTLVGISGDTYRQSAGYTFETQHFPDSPNEPDFPSTELLAGHTMNSTTIFAFSNE
ncbi:MAG TPA: aldose epimerase family protein [Actinospica sp.]|jgi:aldose 1-epimerase|nr:aldose epimerase family protein [Actinospica sp.]